MNLRCRITVGLLSAVAATMQPGCTGEEADTRPRQAVSGEVTLDGKPLEQGSIIFDPKSKADGVAAEGKISAGQFAIAKGEGPTPGSYFVRIGAGDLSTPPRKKQPGDEPQFDLGPPKSASLSRYNSNTKLTAEVKADAPNSFQFELSSKVEKSKSGSAAKR